MSRADIRRRFDEIVDFSGVETYLDTPVKRYSSGMYMRLAFAVAAHLEPEVLVVDEVLAVGDSEFQKRCLGKMSQVAGQGRTVLFVSHNMGAVQQLCNNCLLLQQGQLSVVGPTKDVVVQYLTNRMGSPQAPITRKGNGRIQFQNFFLSDLNGEKRTDFLMGETICVNFTLAFVHAARTVVIALDIRNQMNECYAHILNEDDGFIVCGREGEQVQLKVDIPKIYFTPHQYLLSLWVGEDMVEPCDYLQDCMPMELIQGNALKRRVPYPVQAKTYLESTWMIAV